MADISTHRLRLHSHAGGAAPAAPRWTSLLVHVARGLWIALVIAVCVKSVVDPLRHTVYPVFVNGGHNWIAGTPLHYSNEYVYGPLFAVMFVPLAMLPVWLGSMIWSVSCIACLVYALRVFTRDVLPKDWPAWARDVVSIVTFCGSLRSVWCGQSNSLILACVLLACAAIAKRQWWRAAFLLAVPVHMKVWGLVAVALFGAVWPKKLMLRLAVAVVAIGLVPFAFGAPSRVAGYYADWTRSIVNRQGEVERWPGYRDAWTVWEQFGAVDKLSYFKLQAGLGLAVLAWCLWQSRGANSDAQLATYVAAMWTVWQLFVGPGSERPTYIIAAPFLAWGVVTCFLEKRLRLWSSIAVAMTVLLGAGGIERLLLSISPSALAIQPLGIAVFGLWLVAYAHNARRWPTTDLERDNKPPHRTTRETARLAVPSS
jgi:hypothetical protein